MRWRSKIRHIRRRFRREKACRTTPVGVTVLSYRATESGVTRLNFQKIITLRYDVDEDGFYIKIVDLFSFEFFRLTTIRCSKKLYKVSAPK
jgi:hypothetical protein